jgi:tetratricopeptide (TPR) repeat protein
MFDFNWQIPANLFLQSLMVGALFGHTLHHENKSPDRKPWHYWRDCGVATLLFMVLIPSFYPWHRQHFLATAKTLKPALPLEAIIPALRYTALEKSAEATFLIGKILENIDHHTEAEEYYRRSILRDPHNSYYQEELAMFFLRQKRFEEALQAALSVIKLDGRHFPYLLQRITPKIQDPLRLQVLVPEDEKSQLFWLNFLRDHNFLDIALTTAIQNRQRFTSCPNPFMMAAIEIETLQKRALTPTRTSKNSHNSAHKHAKIFCGLRQN